MQKIYGISVQIGPKLVLLSGVKFEKKNNFLGGGVPTIINNYGETVRTYLFDLGTECIQALFLAEFAVDFQKNSIFSISKKKGHFRFWKNSVLFLQRISSAQISLKYTPNFFGCDLKKPRIISFFYGEKYFLYFVCFPGIFGSLL